MPTITWDKTGERTYESGLDRGVLYLPDGSAVPWNGLLEVVESFDKETTGIYYDGAKISELVSFGDFAATMKALTYPDEFIPLEGSGDLKCGIGFSGQETQYFGLCYRTRLGDDVEGSEAGYKIHLLYNVVAIPNDKTHDTVGQNTTAAEFEWSLSAVPEDVAGFRPTSHFVIDTKEIDPWLLEEVERVLYGDSRANAALISMADLIALIDNWFRLKITDNGDGTWTAESKRGGFISFESSDIFDIIHANAVYLNDYTFVIDDTGDICDIPVIIITDNGDGSWVAYTKHPDLFTVTPEGEFTILDANATFTDDWYSLSDTFDEPY